jgi:hypothetical protein
MHSASSGTDPTAKDPEKLHLGYSQFLCNIMWASPQLSFHSCNYGTFIGWCLHDLRVTCIHKYHRCYTSRLTTMLLQLSKHTDCMMLTRLIYCLFDAVYQLIYCSHWELRAFGNACHMCNHDHSITIESCCALSSTHVTMHFTVTNNTVEKFDLLCRMTTRISNTKHLRTWCATYSLPCF